MAGAFSAVLGPVVRRSTYRRWVYLILGGALLVPFTLLAAVVIPSIVPRTMQDQALLVVLLVVMLVVGVMVLMSFIPAVRVIEGTAARELLGDAVPEQAVGRVMSWPSRWRSAGWFVLHVVVGGVLSMITLALPPAVVVSLAVPFTGTLNPAR